MALIEANFCYNSAKYNASFVILFSVIIRNDLCIKSARAFPTTLQLHCHLTLLSY